MDKPGVIKQTRLWIESVVIGLDLCPFARRVFEANRIQYIVSEATEEQSLKEDLARELTALATAPITSVETTLLIHPKALGDFLEYNDFLDVGDRLIKKLGLRGIIQLASFHPDYQFAETEPDAVENFTNRSPYPMLHLLREDSIEALAMDSDELLEIPRRNIERMRSLGITRIQEKLKAILDPSN